MAEVVFATWQAVFLIVLCFASLIIALYCLFFMVPLRSFMKHVNSLGGGMEGMRSHVEGVRDEVESRIDSLAESFRGNLTQQAQNLHQHEEKLQEHGETLGQHEKSLARQRQKLNRQKQELGASVSSAAQTARAAQEKLQAIEGVLHNVQAKLRERNGDVSSLAKEMETLRSRHAGLSNDFEVLESELQGEVQRSVKNSYRRLESTVLGALEELQDEMLRSTHEIRGRKDGPGRAHPGTGHHFHTGSAKKSGGNGSNKIISAEPLFSEVEHDEEPSASPDETESNAGGEQSESAN
jgi:predicted  nucleic acid-binding Zn-ribbon protein